MPRRISTFSELASLYFPGCSTQKNAVHCLNRWVKGCDELVCELAKTGYKPYNHRYLMPIQYTMITKYLGDPFED